MAAYLIHGFKWPRAAIRIHVIINNIDDAAPDWTMSSSSCQAFKDNLETLFPDTMAALADFRLIEQYNTIDENCQPHAFVADFVKEIPFSLDVDQVRLNHSFTPQAWEAMCDLRDHLSVDEKIHWYIVFNCDPERDMGPDLPPKDDDDNWVCDLRSFHTS